MLKGSALLTAIFPKNPKIYLGYTFVRVIAFVYMLVIIARSCIHLFSADGGAESIAGIDTSVAGGQNIIAIFHQWGAIQLLLISFMTVLFFFYQGLTPLIVLFLSLDAPLRALAGMMGKVESAHTPPGEALNWPAFFLLLILFIVSLLKAKAKQ